MNSRDLEYVNSLIGKPWKSGARGPDFYNCWFLCRDIQKTLFNRDLPIIEVDEKSVLSIAREFSINDHRKKWKEVPVPSHGCLVEMSSGKHPFHIGVYLEVDGGGVIHCQNPSGVVFDKMQLLPISGWRKLRYNDWIG